MFEIGSSLREARTRQGLDINDMEMRTKIRAKYLRALEAEHFDQLPGHTYIKGFLRTYADSLGMDGQLYVDEYNSRFVAGEEEQPVYTRRAPLDGTPPPRERAARVAPRRDRGGRDRDPHGARDRGVEVRRPHGAEGAGRQPARGARGRRREGRVRHGHEGRLVHGGACRSLAGKPLYRGTLERGQTKRFPSKKLSLTSPPRATSW